MRTNLAVLVLMISTFGCEGTTISNSSDSPHHAFRAVDGRDQNFDTHHTDAAAPVWPADSDSGSSSGSR